MSDWLADWRKRPVDCSVLLGGAGQQQLPLAHKGSWAGGLLFEVELTAICLAVRRRLRRVVNFHTCSAGPSGLGRLFPFGHHSGDCLQCPLMNVCSVGGMVTLCAATEHVEHACESWGGKPIGAMKVKADFGLLRQEPLWGHTVDRSQATLWRDLSKSVPVATRKMVNYA